MIHTAACVAHTKVRTASAGERESQCQKSDTLSPARNMHLSQSVPRRSDGRALERPAQYYIHHQVMRVAMKLFTIVIHFDAAQILKRPLPLLQHSKVDLRIFVRKIIKRK